MSFLFYPSIWLVLLFHHLQWHELKTNLETRYSRAQLVRYQSQMTSQEVLCHQSLQTVISMAWLVQITVSMKHHHRLKAAHLFLYWVLCQLRIACTNYRGQETAHRIFLDLASGLTWLHRFDHRFLARVARVLQLLAQCKVLRLSFASRTLSRCLYPRIGWRWDRLVFTCAGILFEFR